MKKIFTTLLAGTMLISTAREVKANTALDDLEMDFECDRGVYERNLRDLQHGMPHVSDAVARCYGYQNNAIDINASDIDTNTTNITTNASSISSNEDDITANTTNITANTSSISSNADDITDNTTNITTNASSISSNADDITDNTTNITANTSSISSNADDITENTTNITTNASSISSNADDIQTNASAIQNLQGSSSTADITANTNKINTNTSNISSLGEGVAGSTALTAALTALPQTSKDSKLSCGIGTGAYSSRYAVSFGCASKVNERVDLNAGGSFVFGGSKSYGGGTLDSGVVKAGFVFKLGELNKPTQISLNESKVLKKEVKDLEAKNNQLLARLEKLENIASKFQLSSEMISVAK